MSEQIPPCPMCGSDDIRAYAIVVECNKCGLRTGGHASHESAVRAWSNRVPVQPTTATPTAEQNELTSPQEQSREAEDLRKRYTALEKENYRLHNNYVELECLFEKKAAENAALKQQLADSELAFNHANEVVGKLEADVARLDWQPITPESLPKVGDEVYGKYCGDVHKVTNAMADWGAEKLTERCFHYFRPINPPSRTAPAKETE